uniref:NADH-ubiquinone oxidoreductase chain 2 n=1 Tax=Philaenus spumarius TaxID=36667 RepID=Q6IT36_PHISP|nr:NADH dehydrogenase subunit 2 [Philaenus spumarius]AAT39431.1 NADH dehydrogenase subunit 2 [Philaenus spumarius]
MTMMNSTKMIFLLFMFVSPLISLSSNNWFGSWMGLEINLISFTPLMPSKNNYYSSESSMKYFIIQSVSSMILLLGIISLSLMMSYSYLIMICALMAKLGVAPFHMWAPSVMEGISWFNCFIFLTWQKLAGLMLMSYIIINSMVVFPVIASLIIGSFGGINQSSMKKLMAYSSINNMGWIIMGMTISFSLWMSYFLIYTFMVYNLIYLFMIMEINYLNQFLINMHNSSFKIILSLLLFSFGGVPPLLGFLPKLIIIQSLMLNSNFLILLIMIMTSLITLFYYIRVTTMMLMVNSSKIKFNNYLLLNSKLFYLMTFMNLFGFGLIFIFKTIN